GVNRSTVREGIRLLEQSGLIHRDSGRGLMASLPHYSRLATRMSRAMLLHEVTFRELWEATTALEIATVEQAAEHATADDIAELEANVASTAQASADPAVVGELDTQFHSLIAKASQNRVLQLAREPSSLLIFPTTEIILRKLKEGVPRLIQAHRKIVDAVRQHDKEASHLWMLRHATDWRRGFERAGKDVDQPIDRVYMKEAMARWARRSRLAGHSRAGLLDEVDGVPLALDRARQGFLSGCRNSDLDDILTCALLAHPARAFDHHIGRIAVFDIEPANLVEIQGG